MNLAKHIKTDIYYFIQRFNEHLYGYLAPDGTLEYTHGITRGRASRGFRSLDQATAILDALRYEANLVRVEVSKNNIQIIKIERDNRKG